MLDGIMESPARLLLGLVTGIVFGVLLQKARVAKYRVIVGQFLLRDWTVLRVVGTAVLVGGAGVYLMRELGVVTLHVKPTLVAGILVGGVLFGFGMALLGYCPGTSMAAMGEGRRDAAAGVLGMLTGAFVHVAFYGSWRPLVYGGPDLGEQTLATATNSSPWLWVGLIALAGVLAHAVVIKREVWHRSAHKTG